MALLWYFPPICYAPEFPSTLSCCKSTRSLLCEKTKTCEPLAQLALFRQQHETAGSSPHMSLRTHVLLKRPLDVRVDKEL